MILAGKVALVTGAGRGLGQAHSMALAAAGAKVIVNDLGGSAKGEGQDASAAQTVVDMIVAAGGIAVADHTDISSWAAAGELVDRVVREFGQLDILINNAGVCRPTAFGTISEEDWCRLMDVNAKGTAALIEAAARHWKQAGPQPGRAVVCTASSAGTNPHSPLGVYGVTKAAVLAIAQVAAQELAPLGVRVNALAPIARTRMMAAAVEGFRVDLDRIMPCDAEYDLYLPEHVARFVLYLVSPLCPFTGRTFGVRADDIFVFSGWDAGHHISNGGKPWEIDDMATAMATMPLQDQSRTVGPQGQVASPSPADAVLTALSAI